jgi:hypothetical protein
MTACRALLNALARDADIFEVLSALEPLHPRNDTFPGEVFLTSSRTRRRDRAVTPIPIRRFWSRLFVCAARPG